MKCLEYTGFSDNNQQNEQYQNCTCGSKRTANRHYWTLIHTTNIITTATIICSHHSFLLTNIDYSTEYVEGKQAVWANRQRNTIHLINCARADDILREANKPKFCFRGRFYGIQGITLTNFV